MPVFTGHPSAGPQTGPVPVYVNEQNYFGLPGRGHILMPEGMTPEAWFERENQRRAQGQANHERSKNRWNMVRNIATAGAAIPFAMAAGPALSGLFGGGSTVAAPAAAGGWSMPGVTAPTFGLPTLATQATQAGTRSLLGGFGSAVGRLFNSRGGELLANTALGLYGQHSQNRAADQARSDLMRYQSEALALQRQQLEAELRNADLDREDARALNAAINDLKRRELEALEEERAYQRQKDEAYEARRAPYRAASAAALRRLNQMWGLE